MFTYTHEMQQAIYNEIQKIAKYRIYDPQHNIYTKTADVANMDRRTLCAWHFERSLYQTDCFRPYREDLCTNVLNEAGRLAEAFYNREKDDFIRRTGEDGFKWYLSLPVK